MSAPQPRMHGITHVPGGPDPIPCCVSPTAVGTYEELVLAEPTLWAYWPMSDPTGSTEIADASGNDRTLTVHGTPTFEQAGPLDDSPATSILFDGTDAHDAFANDCLERTNADLEDVFDEAQPHTFEIFVYPVDSGGGIMFYWDGVSSNSEIVWLDDLDPVYTRAAGLAPGIALNLDTWTHLAVTYDGTTQRLYLNGELIGSTAGGTLSLAGFLIIGARREIPTTLITYFNGRLAQGALYTSALDISTIAAHANAEVTPGDAGGTVLTSDGTGATSWQFVDTGSIADEAVTPAKIEPGTDGYWLKTEGGAVVWAAAPAPTTPDRIIEVKVIDDATTLTTGDGKMILAIPAALDGLNLTDAHAFVTTVSSSGTPTVQIRNITQTADMLTTRITIDASEFTSYSAAAAPVIDTGNDDVATGDLIAVDVDVAGTGAKGLGVILTFA